jgi:hypothetical protein
MDEQRATDLSGRLVNLTAGWSDEAALELTRELMTWRDWRLAEIAIDNVAHSWVERSRPPLGVIVRAYNEAVDAQRRRDAENLELLDPDYAPMSPRDGREIAYATYRQSLGLPNSQATRDRMFSWGSSRWASVVESKAPDEDVVLAMAAIGGGAMYREVLTSFGADHLRAGRALRALEKAGQISHGNDGWIMPR